jgi:acyl carrier protein
MREDSEFSGEVDDERFPAPTEHAEPELTLVRHVIASHLSTTVEAIGPQLELSADLGLSVVGRVMIALDLQDVSPVRWTFDDVRDVRTVGEFASLLRARRALPQ